MTLAQNHQLRLSGNSWFLLCIFLIIGGCSPKIVQTVPKPVVPKVVEAKPVEKKPEPKFTQANIALLIPFRLNEINLATATKADIEQSAMAIDFYQGFKLGVDSAAASGLNFKLNVYDTRDDNSHLDELIKKNSSLAESNIIIGPVFPQGLKHMASFAAANGVSLVNPLAASHPNEFNNPNLISVVNNIDLHAGKIGDYIANTYNPASTVVVLINPKGPDQVMANPIRAYFANKKPFVFQEYASVFTMEMNLVKGKKYVIIVSSSDRKFVVPTIDKLIKMRNAGLDVALFGHPDWIKQNYNIDRLQALSATVSSSYKVDYKREGVNAFIRKYRAAFNFEPGEYSFKGFDVGFYFASLLARHKADFLEHLTREKYKGLHNNLSFIYDEKLGYINT
ncbi:MAG: amino acid ABC transporter substrate-binding protein, partial [Sphingobacteriales bacterium]